MISLSSEVLPGPLGFIYLAMAPGSCPQRQTLGFFQGGPTLKVTGLGRRRRVPKAVHTGGGGAQKDRRQSGTKIYGQS